MGAWTGGAEFLLQKYVLVPYAKQDIRQAQAAGSYCDSEACKTGAQPDSSKSIAIVDNGRRPPRKLPRSSRPREPYELHNIALCVFGGAASGETVADALPVEEAVSSAVPRGECGKRSQLSRGERAGCLLKSARKTY